MHFIYTHLEQIQQMPFVEFMQLALYHPQWGYYSSGRQKFGEKGDFTTAPELTPLFGQALAHQCQQWLPTLSNPIIFEFGAGSGRLCVDLLKHLDKVNCLPFAYYILEVSSHLRARQQALIQQNLPHLATRVHWLSSWPSESFDGIIIANEVLDAMPVHRFLHKNGQIYESMVSVNNNRELKETFLLCTDQRLTHYLEKALPHFAGPYQSEANLFIDGWIKECSNSLRKGVILLIDYGFPRHEYYHPDRQMGTLMCHYRQQTHTNPFLHLGEQDITAHVDFTHVAEAAEEAHLHVASYTNQASFLLANNLLSFLEEIKEERARLKANQAVKLLSHPSEMGELFKVMILMKDTDLICDQLQRYDKRASL